MERLLQALMAVILLSSDKACAQPGLEGYRGKSGINMLLKDYAATKIGRQAIAVKGLPRHVEAPEMK